MNPIILRYNNYEADTATEHQVILDSRGFAWWGWWKKLHEPFPADAFTVLRRELQEGAAPIVGLVNRADRHFYEGVCVGLTAIGEGKSTPSPNQDCTPAYYRELNLPAWFRFSAIRKL